MERRKIGSLEVSVVGLGANNFGNRLDRNETATVLGAALDVGVNFIDTADMYSKTASEAFIGDWLRGQRRDDVVVATKFGMAYGDEPGGASAAYVRSAIDGSLRRLGTDYIDLYIVHRPDPGTPIGETIGALSDLIAQGKVREIGCSDFSVGQLREAEAAASGGAPRFVNLQREYSLLNRAVEADALPLCAELGVGFVPYRPLAHGLLTGKYRSDQVAPQGSRLATAPADRQRQALSVQNLQTVERLMRFAEDRGHSLLELAMSWLLVRAEVSSIIAGAMSADQIRTNAEAASWALTSADIAEVDRITER